MDWEHAMSKCNSNKDGECQAHQGKCDDNIKSGVCTIVKLRDGMKDAMHLTEAPRNAEN